ncbi:putative DNA modification/repair radical SAM protein [Sphingomonas sp. MMS24-JH45]
MAQLDVRQKLEILADAAKYNASCASSGTAKRNSRDGKGLGSTEGMGICHAYAPDGRCISLLKILLTNSCIFDCHYCINRKSSNVRRARFTAEEVVNLTLAFYRRNYIEGLFLSSGIIASSNYTMEQIVEVARSLREDHHFRGYIRLKTIPDADPELVHRARLCRSRVDQRRTAHGRRAEAACAEKDNDRIEGAMRDMKTAMIDTGDARKRYKSAPKFAPAGQSTQMIVGADAATDGDIVTKASTLYDRFSLRRVYYSAFSPIPDASAVLPLQRPPLMREHRLYQSDWLMRFYGFAPKEVVAATDPQRGLCPLDIDPKLAWALKFREHFPVDVNRAPREMLLRVPGLGTKAVANILAARRWRRLRLDDVARLTVSVAKVRPFIVAEDWRPVVLSDRAELKPLVAPRREQLELFAA